MRILTNFRMHLRHFAVFFDVEEYDGPVVYAGGGGTTVENEIVPTGPFGPQIPFILSLFEQAADLFNQGPLEAFGNAGQQIIPDVNQNLAGSQAAVGQLAGGNIDQNQQIQQLLQQLAGGQGPGAEVGQSLVPGIQGGIDAQLGAGDNALSQFAGPQAGQAQNAFSQVFGQQGGPGVTAPGTQGGQADINPALATLLGGGGGQNPFLDQLVQSAVQTQTDAFNRSVLPGIRSEAQQAGQIGGSRQGIAEGIAGADLSQDIGNTVSNLFGNAFGQQAGLQGQAVQGLLGAQQGDVGALLQAAGINNQDQQQLIQSLLQGTGQTGQQIGQGAGLGLEAIGTGTAQAGSLFGQGNQLQLQQVLGSLGLIPGFEASSLGQLGAVNSAGLQQFGLDQAAIDALRQQFTFNQQAPANNLAQFQNFITGLFGSSVGPFPENTSFTGPLPLQGQNQQPQPQQQAVAPPQQQFQPLINPQQPPPNPAGG